MWSGVQLERRDFTPPDLVLFRRFHCGDAPWEAENAEWMRSGNVLEDVAALGTEVWLYYLPELDNMLVGFGSLGANQWSWPTRKSPKRTVNIIPHRWSACAAIEKTCAAAARWRSGRTGWSRPGWVSRSRFSSA